MKRNETVLVYGVTGLLVVILLVAVLFGNEGEARQGAREGSLGTPRLDDLVQKPSVDAEGRLAKKDAPVEAPASKPAAPGGAEQKQELGAPLNHPASLVPGNLATLSPMEAALLRTVREGDYRKVTVQEGESLSVLMQRFGIDRARTEEVQRLNELKSSLERLRTNEQIILPWVDDATLIAADARRRALDAATKGTPAPSPTQTPTQTPAQTPLRTASDEPKHAPMVATAAKTHKVQKGESLWKIAQDHGGGKNIAQIIDQIRDLNDGVKLDPLREGVVLKLPAQN